MNRYQIGDCIGRGAYGAVFRALDTKTGCVVAIKQFKIDHDEAEDVLETANTEIDVLKAISHPNILKYYGHYKTESELNLILEYCEAGSLQSTIRKFGNISEKLAGIFIYQLLLALSCLHKNDIIHRDIKADNLLSTKDGVLKLSDFGTSRLYNGKATMAGSPYWVAPEIITLNGATTASDIWSLACTTIQLITGEAPYQSFSVPSALFRMVNNDCPPIPSNCSKDLKVFLEGCFVKDVNTRATAENLLNYSWIRKCISSNLPKVVSDNISNHSFFKNNSQDLAESQQILFLKNSESNDKSFSFLDSDDNWEDDFSNLENFDNRLKNISISSNQNTNSNITKNLLISQSTIDLKRMINSKNFQDKNSTNTTLLNRSKSSKSLFESTKKINFDSKTYKSHNHRKSLAECIYESHTLFSPSSHQDRSQKYDTSAQKDRISANRSYLNNQNQFYNLILELVKKMKYFDEFESCIDTLEVYLNSNHNHLIDNHLAILSSIVVELFDRISQNMDLVSKLIKLVLSILKISNFAALNFCLNGILPHIFKILDYNSPKLHGLKIDCIFFIMCLLGGPDLESTQLFMSAGGPDHIFSNIAGIAKTIEVGYNDTNTVALFFAYLNVCHLIFSTKILSDISSFIPLYRRALTFNIGLSLNLAINHYIHWLESGQSINPKNEFLSFAMSHVSTIFYTLSSIYSSNLYELSFLSKPTLDALRSILPTLNQDTAKYITTSFERLPFKIP
ncbi:hypothetical protein BB561_004169 [Smittium simulii]|uniref:non-specific serine/threonine protein kinase n=1 Tax=Smittium simulii TaxID=133385 RepID=A0A2T9YHQ2_9FUNG|nr:hypothetical protein BB561_004169 [Smittium simulii]